MSDQRDKILSCACELYLDEGLDGLSMRKLARHVGVTAPALYRHYENREHVLADLVREAYRAFGTVLYRALEGRTPLDRFLRAGEAYLAFALEEHRWYRLLFISPDQMGITELPDDIQALGCAIHQFWVDRVRECMEAGLLRPGDPVNVSLTMWAHAHGLISLYRGGHFRMDEGAFRALYEESWGRMQVGLGTELFTEALADRGSVAEPVGVSP